MSYPRSGSHYLARLIDVNFFDGSNYLRHYGNHDIGLIVDRKPKTIKWIYIYRNVEDVIKSMFRIRGRFGLSNVDDFDKFKIMKMKDMVDINERVGWMDPNEKWKKNE